MAGPRTLQLTDISGSSARESRVDAEAVASLAKTLKAIADPARLRLLSLIAAHANAEACVCDLTEPLGLSQPTVSHHLKILTEAGLLSRDKRGVWAYFAIVPGALDDLATALSMNGLAALSSQRSPISSAPPPHDPFRSRTLG